LPPIVAYLWRTTRLALLRDIWRPCEATGRALVGEATELSPFAVELSALSERELDGLGRYLMAERPLAFRYLSIHGPSKGRSLPEIDLVASLVRFTAGADAIVMHPDTISDAEPFLALGRTAQWDWPRSCSMRSDRGCAMFT
jgi:hypothetical protein